MLVYVRFFYISVKNNYFVKFLYFLSRFFLGIGGLRKSIVFFSVQIFFYNFLIVLGSSIKFKYRYQDITLARPSEIGLDKPIFFHDILSY